MTTLKREYLEKLHQYMFKNLKGDQSIPTLDKLTNYLKTQCDNQMAMMRRHSDIYYNTLCNPKLMEKLRQPNAKTNQGLAVVEYDCEGVKVREGWTVAKLYRHMQTFSITESQRLPNLHELGIDKLS